MKILILAIVFLFSLSACVGDLVLGWEEYLVREPNGRTYLKNMSLKEKLTPEMTKFIDENVIYWSVSKPPSYVKGFTSFENGYRLLKTGQYIYYRRNIQFGVPIPFNGATFNNERPEANTLNLNKFHQVSNHGLTAMMVGYYLVDIEKQEIVIEGTGNGYGFKSYYRFKILPNGNLKDIEKPYQVYEKTKPKGLRVFAPDW